MLRLIHIILTVDYTVVQPDGCRSGKERHKKCAPPPKKITFINLKKEKEMRAATGLFTLSALVVGVEASVTAVTDAARLTERERRAKQTRFQI